jgi:hypothetical protein
MLYTLFYPLFSLFVGIPYSEWGKFKALPTEEDEERVSRAYVATFLNTSLEHS